jgi:hypothetical protein
MPVTQLDKGNTFRALHQGPRAFAIANAWDAGSSRVMRRYYECRPRVRLDKTQSVHIASAFGRIATKALLGRAC